MNDLKNTIRSTNEDMLITDDVLFKKHTTSVKCNDTCKCDNCNKSNNFATTKYALYSSIRDAINIYDRLENEHFDDSEINESIIKMVKQMRKLTIE